MKKINLSDNVNLNQRDNIIPEEFIKWSASNIVEISNVVFNWAFLNKTWISQTTFINCEFNGNINLYKDVTFIDCIFNDNEYSIKFNSWTIKFEKVIFKKDFEIKFNVNYWNISFVESKFKNISLKYLWTSWIYFHDTFFDKLLINDIKIIEWNKNIQTWSLLPFYIDINSNKKTWDIFIDSVDNLENLHIWDTRKKWSFWKIEIHNINFLSWDKNSYIINDSKISKLDIRYCSNFSNKLIFQNLTLDYLYLKNSDLWRTTFNWVSINKLFLENVTLNDCIFNWVDFPESYKLEESKIVSNRHMKDNYRQLKHVMDKNWNITEANKFYELEMEYEMKKNIEVKIFTNWFLKWLRLLWKEGFKWKKSKFLWERIVLFFWKNINEFWNNWLLPLRFIIVFCIFSTLVDYSYYDFINKKDVESIIYNFEMVVIQIGILVVVVYLWIRHFIILLLFILALLIYTSDWYLIELFFEYLYPLYWLKQDFIKSLNYIELWSFVFFKIIYWILLWHLWVALKRTTRR